VERWRNVSRRWAILAVVAGLILVGAITFAWSQSPGEHWDANAPCKFDYTPPDPPFRMTTSSYPGQEFDGGETYDPVRAAWLDMAWKAWARHHPKQVKACHDDQAAKAAHLRRTHPELFGDSQGSTSTLRRPPRPPLPCPSDYEGSITVAA
jgi:hypothetical protein